MARTKANARRTAPLEVGLSVVMSPRGDVVATGGDRADEVVGENQADFADGDNEVDEDDFADGDNEEGFGSGEDDHIPIEENAAEILSTHFGNIVGEADDGDSENICDEAWRDDVIPDAISEEDEETREEVSRENSENVEDREGSVDSILKLGKCFNSAVDFKQALLRYSLMSQYDIRLYMSNAKKLGAVCSDKENSCSWRVYCSYEKRKHKLQIKVLEPKHSCIRSGYSKLLKCSTIAQLFEEKLRINPKFRAVDMADEIKSNYNLIVTVEQCRKAKAKLANARRRTHEAQFARIWDYEAELHKTNQGTIVDIQTIPGPIPGSMQRFDKIYICFEAQRLAWRSYCRPIIGLDGAFLKWDVKGHLLAAVGRDGDNRIVPIAWAVVEIENDVNWDWFVTHLKQDLGLGDGSHFTIMSDKQKGLVKAVQTQLPEAEHRMCARHILGNWKRESHDIEIERQFWKIARSYTMGDFTDNMECLRQNNAVAYESLLKTNPHTWSRSFFKVGACCNDILNNLSESFNRTIREARRKPLLDLLEDIRRQCMVRTAKRAMIAFRLKTRFTRSAHKQIEMARQKSRECVRYMATGEMHEVCVHGCSYRVEMWNQKCGCGKWQLNGIPCEHAASVITGLKLRVDDFVSNYFTTVNWQKTYHNGIQPVEGMKLWPRVNRLPVLPPPNRIGKSGRPSNYARRRSAGESSSKSSKTKLSREKRVMSCSNCREEGHNKKSCKKAPVEPAAKRPRGRPRKQTEEGSQGGSQVYGSQFEGSQVGGSQFGGSEVGGSQVGGSQVGG